MKKSFARKGEIDFPLFCTVLLLLAIGVIMVYSASSWTAQIHEGDSMKYLKRQGLWAILGIVAMIFTISFDYHKIKKFTIPLMAVSYILLLAVFAFKPVNGARRWIQMGGASIQPSEIAKYVVVLFIAMALDIKGEKVKKFWTGLFPMLVVAGIYAGTILLEPNMSICSVIMIVTFIMLFAAGGRIKHFLIMGLPAIGAAMLLIVTSPYRLERLVSFTNPWKDPTDTGYQLIQSLLALGAGGIWGLGLGKSRQKTFYMPEPHNDFIFSIIGEELGLIGCIIIISLFIILVWRGIKIALSAKDTYGSLIAIGITGIIAVQATVNIAVVTGSMPVTGVPLPFISYGGSSLVFNMTAIGILLNISRNCQKNNE
jgi:cell division protein FtsW